jgi:hypothetical protein
VHELTICTCNQIWYIHGDGHENGH